MRHLLTLADLKSGEIERIFAITEDLKTKYQNGLREPLLPGRVMALLFEKPRCGHASASRQASSTSAGTACSWGTTSAGVRARSMADFGRVLSEYVDVVVVRTKSHEKLVELAKFCKCSVINGLTDFDHPCQALADLYTCASWSGTLAGQTLAFIGDGNNVARSLAMGCGKTGMRFALAAPQKLPVRRRVSQLAQEGVARSRPAGHHRPARGGQGRLGRLYRRLDQHGARGGSRAYAAKRSPSTR